MASINTLSTLTPQQNRQAWRYVNLLLLAQALGAASPPIIISLGGIVGESLTTNKALSILPVSLYNIGLALSMIPVSWLIRRFGRQQTYTLGTLCSCTGGVVAALGIINSSFEIFCVGTALAGCYGACVQSYRFAVTDFVPKPDQPQAISRVMLGGLAAAVIGPQLVIWTQNVLPTPLAGSFLSQAFLAILALVIVTRIGRITAGLPEQGRFEGGVDVKDLPENERPRTLLQVACTFKFISTAFAGLVSYGLMTFMMTATPLAMIHAGHGLSTATLGVGWNFGFIGATAMVTDCYRPSERTKVQALNDTLVFGTTATASLLSGQLLHVMGWFYLNVIIFPPIAIALLLFWYQKRIELRVPGGEAGTVSGGSC